MFYMFIKQKYKGDLGHKTSPAMTFMTSQYITEQCGLSYNHGILACFGYLLSLDDLLSLLEIQLFMLINRTWIVTS